MDAGTLRIILIVLGVLLLGALYLWEQRRIERDAEPDESEQRDPRPSARPSRREPSFGGPVAGETTAEQPAAEPESRSAAGRSTDSAAAPGDADDVDSEQADLASAGGGGAEQPPPAPRSSSSSGYERPASSAPASDDSLLVQLFVVNRGEAFQGSAVRAAAARLHLIPGEMEIYHRRNPESSSQRGLFSMANLVNPGTFPFDAMDSFTTPGVALFAQLDGMPSDLMVYDELVQTARAIAEDLGGELLLSDRRPFDDAAWEELRTELLGLINARADALMGGTAPVERDGLGPMDAETNDDRAPFRP